MLLGNNFECKIRGIDLVRLKLNDGLEKILFYTMYVLNIKKKLISIGVLNGAGYIVKA